VALYLDSNVFNPNLQPLGMDVRVDVAGQLRILIFSMSGQEVEKLVDQQMLPGNYRFYWDGHDQVGRDGRERHLLHHYGSAVRKIDPQSGWF
jgi:hypothetical protein